LKFSENKYNVKEEEIGLQSVTDFFKQGQKLCPIRLIKNKFYRKIKERLLQKSILPAANHPIAWHPRTPKA
jgi:hypothetical protein